MKYKTYALIGSGGREHALCWALSQSHAVEHIICIPGNAGTSDEAKCHNMPLVPCLHADESELERLVRTVVQSNADIAIIGPEDPLASGIADRLESLGIKTVGAKKRAAQLEASKDVAKQFMKNYGIACASSHTFEKVADAEIYLDNCSLPIVVKADGLAAGKGVVVTACRDEARKTVRSFMNDGVLGNAGKKIIIEEYLQGSEISILAAVCVDEATIQNGKACIMPFLCARDHKRLRDGAEGPNTGGMGAIAPVSDVDEKIWETFERTILEPTVRGLIAEKMEYHGFIFFGLMLTAQGPKLLEYNVRLGDPETQAVLPLIDFDFASLCCAITDGTLKDFPLKWKKGFVCAPVAVSKGYPAAYEKGKIISFDAKKIASYNAHLFAAGAVSCDTEKSASCWKTSGGRVLSCAAYGDTLDEARNAAYDALSAVQFEGMFFRKDIGLPGAADSALSV